MEATSCLIRLQNPVLESVSFFSNQNTYKLLCRFSLHGKLRHALVKVNEQQWADLLDRKYEHASTSALAQKVGSLRHNRSWGHLNLLHGFPYFSQTEGCTFLLRSSISESDKSQLELVNVTN